MSAVLIYGEILFDRFPSGETVLGGAPMNVAWHLHAFGLPVTLVSRIGNDALGKQACTALTQAGLDISQIQRDDRYPTGTVDVQLVQGSPHFDIVENVAYDYIQSPQASILSKPYALLYHGSLALRHPVSNDTLNVICKQIAAPVFVDVNLRAPFWNTEQVMQHVKNATWVKLNHEELALLTDVPVMQQRQQCIESAKQFRSANNLQALIVTCGADGAFIVADDQVYDMDPVVPVHFVDTVGAGDAFSAVTITGLIRRWPYPRVLELASQFAARICGIRGAIPDETFVYPDLTRIT